MMVAGGQAGCVSRSIDETSYFVYSKCMAVKTITIDLEAYDELAKRKRHNESFSQVIKRILREERYSAKNLLDNLDDLALSPDTLTSIERVVADREQDYPERIDLD